MTASPLGHIGRYELLAKLAAGGMGEVFLARTHGTGGFEKRLVIKRILPHLADDPEFVRRFIAEGKLVVRLRHAGIAQVIDMGEEAGVTFIAMEHVDGRDLGELVRLAHAGDVDTPVPLIATIIVRLLEALDYAHTATDDDDRPLGIIHRDISPSNVMISRAGEVKLLDFGIARATERLQATTTGAIRGKYSYMSPQQAAGADLDARSDLFSVGVLMWELLAGFRPFDGQSDLLTLDRIRFFDPGSLALAAPGVPAPVAAVVDRLLQKDPADRFASAEAAMRALMAWLNEVGAVVVPRDLSAWLDRVLETIPEGLRRRPSAGLSLDDVLLMGLASDPGKGGGGTDPVPDRAPFTRTVSAAGDAGPYPAPSRPVTRPSPLDRGTNEVPSAPPGMPVAPQLAPLAAGSPYPTDPDTPAVWAAAVTRGRRTVFVLLVALNLLLLGAVAWLVIQSGDDEPSPPLLADGQPDVAAPDDASGPEPTLAAATLAEADVVSEPAEVMVASVADTLAPEEPDAAPPPVPGSGFGALVAAVGDVLLPDDVTVTIRATPGGQVAVTGLGSAASPRTISGRPGTVLRGRVTLADHHPKTFDAVLGEDEVVQVSLTPLPRGTLKFRFLPANARVLIDGDKLVTGKTNIVIRALPVGTHRLEIVAPDGASLTRTFEIRAGDETNLHQLEPKSGTDSP